MSNEFQSLDIILFAMIAIFLALRLRSALGRRDGNDNISERRAKPEDGASKHQPKVVELPNRKMGDQECEEDSEVTSEADVTDQNPWSSSEMGKSLSRLVSLDPTFSDENFVVGARVAFEMVLTAFSSGDTTTLKKLLSAEVYSNFSKVIKDREKAGSLISDTLVGISSSEIVELYLEGHVANITVKFVSEQIKVSYDDAGEVIDGDPKAVITVTDFWTFARDTKSKNPNWSLIATRSLD